MTQARIHPRLEFQESPQPFLHDHETLNAEAQAAARAVVNLLAKWNLTDAQSCILLGGISLRSFARWKTGDFGRIPRDLQTRLSILLGIHKSLRIIFREVDRAYAWIGAPNAAFGGTSARDVMLAGEITDLSRVRNYLDAERGGW